MWPVDAACGGGGITPDAGRRGGHARASEPSPQLPPPGPTTRMLALMSWVRGESSSRSSASIASSPLQAGPGPSSAADPAPLS